MRRHPTSRSDPSDDRFFTALENGHSVSAACEAARYTRRCVYRWREGDHAFAERWAAALVIAQDLLEEEADRRGRDGYDEAVFFKGQEAGAKRKYSDALLLARLKAVRPQHYRDMAPKAVAGDAAPLIVVIRDVVTESCLIELIEKGKLAHKDLQPALRARLKDGLEQRKKELAPRLQDMERHGVGRNKQDAGQADL